MVDESIDLRGTTRAVGMPGAFAPDGTAAGDSGGRINDTFTGSNGTSLSGRTPDTSDIGTTWTIEGTVEIQSNRVSIPTVGHGAWIDLEVVDQDVTMVFNAGDDINHGWLNVVRDSGNDATPTDGYRVFMGAGGTIALKRMTSGVEAELASVSVSPLGATDHTFRVLHNSVDSTIKVIFDQIQIINVTDPSPPTLGTYIGFTQSTHVDGSARFDSLVAQQLAGSTQDVTVGDSPLSGEDVTITAASQGTEIPCTSSDMPLSGEMASLTFPILCTSSDMVLSGETVSFPSPQFTVGVSTRVWGKNQYKPILPEKKKKHRFTEEEIEEALENWAGKF